jgi:hypothetical protein
VFFVSAHSKGVTKEFLVSAHSTRLKVVVFSTSCEWLLGAHSKGVTGASCILYSILIGSAHSKGVRRTDWRGRIVAQGAEESRRLNETIIAYWYLMSMIILSGLVAAG